MNIYTNKLVIFTIVTAVIINVMPSYSTGSVLLAPPQGSDVSSLLAHSNEDNNSAQFLQDRIEIFQDETAHFSEFDLNLGNNLHLCS